MQTSSVSRAGSCTSGTGAGRPFVQNEPIQLSNGFRKLREADRLTDTAVCAQAVTFYIDPQIIRFTLKRKILVLSRYLNQATVPGVLSDRITGFILKSDPES